MYIFTQTILCFKFFFFLPHTYVEIVRLRLSVICIRVILGMICLALHSEEDGKVWRLFVAYGLGQGYMGLT